MQLITSILIEIWTVTVAMAPYLLLGFFMAGVLSVLIPKESVEKHLGGRGWISAFKAALFGVPMPICSCGVIPLAASLRKHGASRGATASFLAATPQTGIDSLMITYALLGGVYALFRALVAFLSGICCGVAVEAATPQNDPTEKIEEAPAPVQSKKHRLRTMLTYGFITLPRDIARSIILGITLSGVISALIPTNYLADTIGHTPYAMLLMLLIGIPLYVCSAGSVPIALAFIKAGISPGAALIFLITGPATNAATLTTLWKIIGKKQLIVFLITLSITALIAGSLMNAINPTLGLEALACAHAPQPHLLGLLSALALIALLLNALRPRKPTCCCSGKKT